MKLIVLLMALAVCSYASPIANEIVEKKVELPSVSAMLVTELLEVTFHMDAELAKSIGHLFRDVPISIAKEMVAFVGKVIADVTQSHVNSLSQYADQAMHIFQQVWEHINVKEVVELIASNVLPPNVVAMLEKLMAIWGRGAIISAVWGAVVTTAVTSAANWLVGAVTGKRGLWDNLVDAAINAALTTVAGAILSLGKRNIFTDIFDAVVTAVVDTALTGLNNALLGLVGSIGKRGLWDNLVDAAINAALGALATAVLSLGKRNIFSSAWEFITDLWYDATNVVLSSVFSLVSWIGKRDAKLGVLGSAVISWGLNQLVSAVLGKRGLFDNVLTAVVNVALNALTTTLGSLLGKRDAKLGVLGSAVISWGLNQLVSAVLGKRGVLIDNVLTAVVETATTWFYDATNVLLSGLFSTVTGWIGKRQRPLY